MNSRHSVPVFIADVSVFLDTYKTSCYRANDKLVANFFKKWKKLLYNYPIFMQYNTAVIRDGFPIFEYMFTYVLRSQHMIYVLHKYVIDVTIIINIYSLYTKLAHIKHNVAILSKYNSAEQDLIISHNENQDSFLYYAIIYNNINMVSFILSRGNHNNFVMLFEPNHYYATMINYRGRYSGIIALFRDYKEHLLLMQTMRFSWLIACMKQTLLT